MPSETKTRGLVAQCLWNLRARIRLQMNGSYSRGVQGAMGELVQCLTAPPWIPAGITDRRKPNITLMVHLSSKARQISSNRLCSSNNRISPWSALSIKTSSISSSFRCRCFNSSNTSSSSKPSFNSRYTIVSSKWCRNINNSSTYSSSSNSN